MTTRHDDADEPGDRVLDSMRTVWLSMRDEDPPAAGLAELLAAARTKAEAMQPHEPWWRRVLVALRRPPVLALATTVVLVGGAVLVGSGRDQIAPATAPSPSESGPSAPQKLEPPAGLDERMQAPGSAGLGPAELANEPAKKDFASPPAADPAPAQVAVRPADVPARPAPPRGTRPAGKPSVAVATKGDDDRHEHEEAGEAKVPAMPAPDKRASRKESAADQGLAIAQDPSTTTTGGQIAGAPELSVSEDLKIQGAAPGRDTIRPTAQDSTGAPVRTRPAQTTTVEQLAKQSATAATRGDCPAVRAIVSRIQKMDRTFYTNHVAANAAVKKCVQ